MRSILFFILSLVLAIIVGSVFVSYFRLILLYSLFWHYVLNVGSIFLFIFGILMFFLLRKKVGKKKLKFTAIVMILLGVMLIYINSILALETYHRYVEVMKSNAAYDLKVQKYLQDLPFKTYKPTYIPDGYQMSQSYPDLSFSNDGGDHLLDSTWSQKYIQMIIKTSIAKSVLTKQINWGEMYQLMNKKSYGSFCPSHYFSVEDNLTEKCEITSVTPKNITVYHSVKTSASDFGASTIYSAAIGNTLILFELNPPAYGAPVAQSRIDEMLKVIDSLVEVPPTQLIHAKQYKYTLIDFLQVYFLR